MSFGWGVAPMTPTIHPESAADREAVHQVNCLAFVQYDEAGIVESLRSGGYTRVRPLPAAVRGRGAGPPLFPVG